MTPVDPFVRPAEPTAAEAIAEIAAERQLLDDPDDWIRHVIELGTTMKRTSPFPGEWKTETFFVPGCASSLWIAPMLDGDRLYFAAAADAFMTAGNVALLLRVYSGRSPTEILATAPDWMLRHNVVTSMTVNRVNGVAAAAQRIRELAAAA